MPESQHDEIVRRFHGEEVKQQFFTSWLANHPCPSWEQVRRLLRGDQFVGGVGGEEGERAAHEVKETYLKSELDTGEIQYSRVLLEQKSVYNIYILSDYTVCLGIHM